jgi:hypothetical protein
MRFFSTGLPSHLIPIEPANKNTKDWIVGPSTERIRVARSTQESVPAGVKRCKTFPELGLR